jgi:hypothetical protein
MLNTMKNIFWMGLGNIAPTELNKLINQSCYYDIAPTEQNFFFSNQIEQLVYPLYELTEEEIKIVGGFEL